MALTDWASEFLSCIGGSLLRYVRLKMALGGMTQEGAEHINTSMARIYCP